jgi:hypothetical protein
MFGWGALFAYASFMAVNFEQRTRPLDWIAPLTSYVFRGGMIEYRDPKVLAFHLLVLNLPELMVAMIGGWLTSSLRVVVARTHEAPTMEQSTAAERPWLPIPPDLPEPE